MHLVPCIRPEGALEPAPASSLREAVAGERWEGFWSVADECFYARAVSVAGSEQWYRIADVAEARPARPRAARVLSFPPQLRSVPRMLVGRYRGNAMLVGTRQRRPALKVER